VMTSDVRGAVRRMEGSEVVSARAQREEQAARYRYLSSVNIYSQPLVRSQQRNLTQDSKHQSPETLHPQHDLF
jgi:hypothetical protein